MPEPFGNLSHGDLVYLGVVLLVGLFAMARTAHWLSKTSDDRQRLLRLRKRFESVLTRTPLDEPEATATQRGIDSIDRQTTVSRRLLLPLIVLAMIGFGSVPFLSHIPAVALSLLATAATVTVGIGAKPVVENAISGLVISSSKLINIGDTVKMNEFYGTVEDIGLTHTTIKVWDFRRYLVPNSQMLQSNVINYSLFDKFLWAYVEFHVSYEADLDVVEAIAKESARASRYFVDHEPPSFWIMETGRESVRCWIAAWADTPSDAWQLCADMRGGLVRAFQKRGIHSHGYRIGMGPPDDDATKPPDATVEPPGPA